MLQINTLQEHWMNSMLVSILVNLVSVLRFNFVCAFHFFLHSFKNLRYCVNFSGVANTVHKVNAMPIYL